MKITLEKLNEWNACKDGIEAFKTQSETDAVKLIELMIATSDIEKIKWANWLIVRVMDSKQRIRYAVFAAEQALPIFEKKYPDDDRPRKAIEAAKKCLENDTEENREAAYYSAYSAAYAAYSAAYAAYYSAYSAAYAAYYAADAAYAAYAAYYAADAAYAAYYAADAAAYDAASAAYRETLLKIIKYGIDILKEDGK
jgi:hypothetical protein